tara:strand:- start:347 stop:511 length:165 start_codon:yes stop_codon:yes gene_type:complete
MLEVLLATLIDCSDISSMLETIRSDKYLTIEAKEEIKNMLIDGTPQCEHNVARL